MSANCDAVEVTLPNKAPKDRESPAKGRKQREQTIKENKELAKEHSSNKEGDKQPAATKDAEAKPKDVATSNSATNILQAPAPSKESVIQEKKGQKKESKSESKVSSVDLCDSAPSALGPIQTSVVQDSSSNGKYFFVSNIHDFYLYVVLTITEIGYEI